MNLVNFLSFNFTLNRFFAEPEKRLLNLTILTEKARE